jgi:hypothetical protein
VTTAEQRRIATLTELVTEALDEPAPSPEVIAVQQRFRKLGPVGQRRVLALWRLQDNLKMLEAGAKADAAANEEVDAARRWARDMGRAARNRFT